MSIQSQFEKFNEKIRLDFESKKELKEKRDIIINKLKSAAQFPKFEEFNQGSYALFTGVTPEENEEYDIDVALIFSKNKDDFEPIDLKNKIEQILKNHTDLGAEIKKPCVTITYKKNGEPRFHVDLVTYLYQDKDNLSSQLYIAKGKNKAEQKWEKADPKGLVTYINDKIEVGKKRDQFRRIVRYLKKWRNQKFSNTGHANPPSIGLTLIVVDLFIYNKANDLVVLINSIQNILDKFMYREKNEKGRDLYSIFQALPPELGFEYNNIFERMTLVQMTDFRDKLLKLKADLIAVRDEVDEEEQYRKLNKIFGDDFEIPNKIESAKKQINYIPSSSISG